MKKLMFTIGFAAIMSVFAVNSANAKDNKNYDRRDAGHPQKVIVVDHKIDDRMDKGRFERHDEHPVIIKYENHGRYDRGPDRYRYERERHDYHYDPRCR